MNKKILLLMLLGAIVALPSMASADFSIQGMASATAANVLTVGLYIIVIGWVVTGVLFLMAQGEPGKLNTAKTALFAVIGGTIILIIAKLGAQAFVSNSFFG